MEFLDWFEDFGYRLAEALCDAIMMACRIFVIVLTLPVWLLPFVYWLIFVKKKDGEDDGR